MADEDLVKLAYDEARAYVAAAKSVSLARRKELRQSLREACTRAKIHPSQVWNAVVAEAREAKDKYPDLLGKLFKDKRGRRHYCVARNPGKNAMFFIEGQPLLYHEIAEKDVYKVLTEFEPPDIPDDPPDWWLKFIPGIVMGKSMVEARMGGRSWGGWYSADINSKFYILPAYALRKHFCEGEHYGGPLRKLTRLLTKDLV